jgi:2-polyprenyl-3-methyl-5-hydroxy-6-metoxy-1,4-benzoquinol methylase
MDMVREGYVNQPRFPGSPIVPIGGDRTVILRAVNTQSKQFEWQYQWENFEETQEFLFRHWIQPRTIDDFAGKRVLDAGCGGGQDVRRVAAVAKHVVGLDLNSAHLAREKLADLANVEIHEADIATYEPDEPFDAIYCLGVIDHTDDPDATFAHFDRITNPGGLIIVWVWSAEGNRLPQYVIEPFRARFLAKRSRKFVAGLARILTGILCVPVYTVYLLPIPQLPYYRYFKNFRRMPFERNALNVFDKLNAPYTEFISRERLNQWFDSRSFEDVQLVHYNGVSWCASGKKRAAPAGS